MRIYHPRKNLGCLGFRISENFYFDFYRTPHYGAYINIKGRRIWIHKNGFKFDGLKIDVIFRLRVDSLSVSRKHLLVH